MSQKINPRQKLLVIGAAVAVLLYVADSIYGVVAASWSARSKEIARLRQDVDKGRSSIERGPRTQATWADMEKNSLPKDPAQAEQELITAFDKWGRANNVELSSIKPQWKRGSTDRYSLLECRIDATGTNSSLARFLWEVEKSPLPLRVETVEINARDNSGQKLGLGLVVTGLRLSPLERK
jgi:hypothetical protein